MRPDSKKKNSRFASLSNSDLLEETKNILIAEFIGMRISELRKTDLMKECNKRDMSFYQNVLNAAMAESDVISGNLQKLGRKLSNEQINELDAELLINPVIKNILQNNANSNADAISSLGNMLGSDYIFFTVSGDSMNGAGYEPGMIVIGERNAQPEDGSIIIASVLGTNFIKRYRITDGKICLESANPNYKTVTIENDMDFKILAVVKMKLVSD